MNSDLLYLYNAKYKISLIKIGQFTPRNLPDRPDWSNKPLLSNNELEQLLSNIFNNV